MRFERKIDSRILRILSVETLDNLYPENERLYVFMDGSKLTDNRNAGAGVCCKLLLIYSTDFDAKIAAIRIVLFPLLCHTDCASMVVILCDIRAAHGAIFCIEAPFSVDIHKCQLLVCDLLQCHKDIAMQWIPSHCGIDENENADCLLKKGTKMFPTSTNRVPF
ncbi:hypothetical protein TNIN_165861 [Trichonephila inaurata madagascariensis]|uniref:RNase H type-1 domain-containing protein n=1 Tax=Trichonephila inaurata madagascariensis TaxID=2747483 RepID=A0A8X6M8J0_9ARAC|nr:hypothetical protein TNIN_165861 [Trichonephila inaurata madagascariensis]